MQIQGKWALVTGASRGVGLRIAKALASQGAKVIVHSRSLDASQQVVGQITAAQGHAVAVAAELSDNAAIAQLIEQVNLITDNALAVLYNNAAIMTPWREDSIVPANDYALSFQVNCIAPAALCDAFLPQMKQQKQARIVNVTSGIADQPQLMAYSCSKAALDRYVRDMLPSLANTSVLMNLMDPGWLQTDLGGEHAPDHPDSVIPSALVPVLLSDDAGSGQLYCAQDYRA
ncbi:MULTISPECIES: SDR family NAD(P)-dependent oxidoreductase [unclassified Agarivorans]|uniref:SDR family NAD(P)-dependent oxidoreductase n=1 Tax=unclassified Agarivorans TaxID=2636026 RepID=UPI0026E1CD13|nr:MULTISPECIES: SDR family NAD(P)-dependent oxidoreductase [unclassified Agarivorans]MDO6683933.1 SDR family NAD(P)-dependent oxidoreductase [Agarivorans sp. 3_MG-2023]MDO6714334.1 SDR family NAD(P)-dependent oxidoreductase [Agarivorans sp. 2_MG-2023]